MANDTTRTAPEQEKLRVFVSYSRDDLDFADQLVIALELYDYDVTIDRQEIAAGENYQERLGSLIREADTVIFALSPASAASGMCAWEVEEAARLGKRIIPVAARPLEGALAPERLRSLDYIFFYPEARAAGGGFGAGLKRLTQALDTDLDWLREHTRLMARASEWEKAGRVENRMLSGADIAEAKAWLARRPKGAPEPTALHLDFIRASEAGEVARHSAERQRLADMAAAQEARAQALADAEAAQRERAAALDQAALEQRARARAQRIIAWGSAAAALVLAVAAGVAWVQWRAANGARLVAEAETQRAEAALAQTEKEKQRAEEQKQQAKSILGDATNLIWTLVEAKKIDKENFDEVAGVFKRGAAFGDTDALVGLGYLYDQGQGVGQDYAKAREWYEKAAAKNNEWAMRNLGILYDNGEGVTQDYGKAREWYEKAAAKDDAPAMTQLGFLYAEGRGVAQDFATARQWFEKAAAKDQRRAMTALGVTYHNGKGVAQDYAKAREWYEKAAAKNDTDAMRNLGVLYANGYGGSQDNAKAREWYEKAAAGDDPDAMLNLAALYEDGLGIDRDNAKAQEWYNRARALWEKAADKDDADAMISLAALYENGKGVPKYYPKAREWYERAAAKGNADAMFKLGVLCENGVGVERDFIRAREWYERAAAKDNSTAMNNLGGLYENGQGVDRDYAKAKDWYEKAAALGDENAKSNLDKLPVSQAQAEGRYADALRLQEALATRIEEDETKRDGKPGKKTAGELGTVAWQALFAHDYAKSLAAGDRALTLGPDPTLALGIETNRAHALMFLERAEEARALYLGHKGETFADDNKLWEAVIADDFAQLRKAGLTHPLMAEIEAALGIAPAPETGSTP